MLATALRTLHRRLLPSPLPLLRPLCSSAPPAGGGGNGGNDNDWSGTSAVPGARGSSSDWGGGGGGDPSDGLGWGDGDSWSTGLTADHFDGEVPAVGRRVDPSDPPAPPRTAEAEEALAVAKEIDEADEILDAVEKDNRDSKKFVDSWGDRMKETYQLLKQVREPGARGAYLKDSEKAEMYRLHKENPEEYGVERLAKDFRVMRQRVHAILWLKEMEEEEEKQLGKPLDDSVEILLDQFPEFFNSHDREFHVASLPYKPDFKVMPEGWDGTTRDPDEVLYEISMKEDQMLYDEFLTRLEFNKMKVAGQVKQHKYSRKRPDEGWNITVEKLGPGGKRGGGGGWKFVSLPDGSSRPLNDVEKVYVKRERPKSRKRIIAPFK